MSQYRNIVIEQGESWHMTVYVTDVRGRSLDLTDYTVAMSMKKSYSSKQSIPFHAEITDAIKGEINIWMDETETVLLQPIRYVYDCIVNGNLSSTDPIVIRFMEGIVTVTPSVSI
jgi:hypothetical protein